MRPKCKLDAHWIGLALKGRRIKKVVVSTNPPYIILKYVPVKRRARLDVELSRVNLAAKPSLFIYEDKRTLLLTLTT
jgi:hypothetical protein